MKTSPSISVIILILSLIFSSNHLSHADFIVDVCNKTSYPDLCISTLRSNPDSASANVEGLVLIILTESSRYASTTQDLINKIIKEIVDPSLKRDYEICGQVYQTAIHAIGDAVDAVKYQHFDYAVDRCDTVRAAVERCGHIFIMPPVHKSVLTQRNLNSQHLGIICINIIKANFHI